MATDTQQVAQNSSTVASNPATDSTGTSGGTAGSNATASMSGGTPTTTAVVAPKGFRQALQQMLQGWQAVVPSDSTVTSSDGPLTQGAVLKQLQEYLGVYTTLDAQATSFKQTRAQELAQLPEVRRYFDVLKAAVVSLVGAGSPQLAQFGLSPKKPRKVLTSSQLAIKAAKAKATRELRGTVGKSKKAPLKAGTTQYAVSVQEAAPGSAPTGSVAASTAPAEPTVNAASPPVK